MHLWERLEECVTQVECQCIEEGVGVEGTLPGESSSCPCMTGPPPHLSLFTPRALSSPLISSRAYGLWSRRVACLQSFYGNDPLSRRGALEARSRRNGRLCVIKEQAPCRSLVWSPSDVLGLMAASLSVMGANWAVPLDSWLHHMRRIPVSDPHNQDKPQAQELRRAGGLTLAIIYLMKD